MESPSMDTVYQAISALHSNPIASEKEKASIWLADVQKSIHSWKIADELLQQKKDVESCYFAAQTMRSKVQHNLSELPAEAVVSLRDSLISHLEVSSTNTNNAILTQLCLAVADLALQMPSWQNCVSDLVKLFSSKNSFVLLEILTVLPQEINSSNLKLGENRREDIKAELRSNSPLVSLFLKESLNNSQSSDVALKIIKCMTSWIQVGAINIQEVPENAVICFSLRILRDENSINILHDAAADCICSILHCLEENNNNEAVERILFDGVSSLEEPYHMAVAHEEEEKAVNYARVFTELGETFLEKIIICAADGSPHFAIRSLELALVCVGHHDYEVAEITFNLWYRLSEEVYQRDYQPLTDVFKPHIERLIEALARHCQYEPDLTKLPEEGDEFYEFRLKVMDLIRDVVFMVGSSAVFRQMVTVLRSDAPWERVEAALFVMQAVAKNILPDEYEYVPQVVEAILGMGEGAHVAVRKTCILVVGELGEWVQQHPEWLSPALQALLRALPHALLAPAAAAALKNICAACRSQAAAHAATLLETARLADQMQLPLNTSSTLMRALASAIGRLPHDQLELAMREATSFQLRGLSALCAQPEEGGCAGAEGGGAGGAGAGGGGGGGGEDPVAWLDRLAALFRDVDVLPSSLGGAGGVGGAHPCLPAFRDAWPVIAAVMDKYKTDSRVMERACRTIRFAVRATGRAAAELLNDFVSVLPQIYACKQHPCILYLTAVLCDALVDPEDCAGTAAAFVHLLHALMPRALELLNKPDGLRDNPDTVDDLFRLCIRYQQRIPLQFLSSGALGAALSLGARAAALDHREASSSLMRFLHDVLRAARQHRGIAPDAAQMATNAVAAYGEELTYALLEASVLHLHSYMLSEVAEVMVELVAYQRAMGVDWVGGALLRLPRPPARATDHQCAQFHQYAMRTEKCKEMTRLLRDFARLYR